jgi:hypothetical protein
MRRIPRSRPNMWWWTAGGNRMGWVPRSRPNARRRTSRCDGMSGITGRRPNFRGRSSGAWGHWTSADSKVGIGHYADESNGNRCHVIICFRGLGSEKLLSVVYLGGNAQVKQTLLNFLKRRLWPCMLR